MSTTTTLFSREPKKELWIRKAISFSIKKAQETKSIITIVVPAKRHVASTPLKYLLSTAQLSKLNNGEVMLIDNVSMRLVSPTSKIFHDQQQVLLVVSGRMKDISKIKSFQNVTHRVVMPYQPEDEEAWKMVVFNEL